MHKSAYVETSVGQVVQVYVLVDGVSVEVISTREAGLRLNYHDKYIAKMCDMGQLIAFKIFGRWLIPVLEVERITKVRDSKMPDT